MKSDLHRVTRQEIMDPRVVEAIFPWLRRLEKSTRTRWSRKLVLDQAVAGDLTLWICVVNREIKAIIGTTVHKYPNGDKAGVIHFCEGQNRNEWLQHLKIIEQSMIEAGCTEIETKARKGWARVLRGDGYDIDHVNLKKRLA
jgi:hypothetical protein